MQRTWPNFSRNKNKNERDLSLHEAQPQHPKNLIEMTLIDALFLLIAAAFVLLYYSGLAKDKDKNGRL